MRIIDEEGMTLDFKPPGRFCENQVYDSGRYKKMVCLAHLAENRLFTCEKKEEDAKRTCSDFRPPS